MLVNRVAQSKLLTFNLETLLPEVPRAHFDLKTYLWRELVLKEKDFRAALQTHDWAQYVGKDLLVYCSNDAIIPTWAHMLVATYAAPHANCVFSGNEERFLEAAFRKAILNLDMSDYLDKMVVIKGCGDARVPLSAYVELTARMQPVVKSLMFGEPCSTVPLYKKRLPKI